MASLCDFPEELIVQVLSELELLDLLSCAQTCRLLNLTIKRAVILQYKMQLAITGLQDCGSSSCLTISERLVEAQMHQESWASLRFRARHLFPIPQYCRIWELCGGVLAYGLLKGFATRGLAFNKFPSIARAAPGRVWEHPDLGLNIRDFAFDPSQDLLVIIAAKPSGSAHEIWDRDVYPMSMSSGRSHPLAAAVPLSCMLNSATDKDGDFVIQIMANYVAVLFHARDVDCRDQLFIWDWKTGRIVTSYMLPGMIQMDAFAFLSPRHFVISKIEPTPLAFDPPELQVYDFLDAQPLWPTTPRFVRAFLLPQPLDGAVVATMTIRSDPTPRDSSSGSYPEGAPFCTDASSHVLVISIVIFHPVTNGDFIRNSFQLFVNSSTLLQGPKTEDTRIVPWGAWGPAKSRILNSIPLEITWTGYVHGTRFVTLDRRGPEPRKSRLRVLDFSSLLVKQVQCQRTPEECCPNSMSSALPNTVKSRVVSASEPTVIPGGQGFKNDVETRLPYRDISSSELFDYRAVMIDEECLVGIGAALVDGRRRFEVLCF